MTASAASVMLANDIIQQLNEDRVHRFPAMETWFPIDVRLSAYRRDQCWALIVETFVFNQQRSGLECPVTMLWCYGNCLLQLSGLNDPELHVVSDGPSGLLFDQVVDTLIAPSATDMTIRGEIIPITTNPANYTAVGIDLSLSSNNTKLWNQFTLAGFDLGRPPRILGYELLRLTAPKCRRLFFATEAEIAGRIGGSMPLLLRLNEWRHPEVNEELYECESFQMIADVVARNDPSLYRPTERPNTHWSNWPMAGTI